MPELPGLTLSQEHFDRVVAAFPGKNAAEKASAYEDWLVNRLIERVQEVEAQRIRAEMDDATTAALAAVTASLPPKRAEPPIRTVPEPTGPAPTLPTPGRP